MTTTDFFAVFGLDRTLAIDVAALQRRFYELSRRWHPDFHQAAPPADRARALEESARVNAAYRALRDPIARVEYLLRLEEGRTTNEGAVVKPKAPPELLAEMFEIQESLEAVRAGSLDEAARASLAAQRAALAARQAAGEARIVGPLSRAWDGAAPADRPRALTALKEALAARAYLRTVIDDLDAALQTSPDDEGHGSAGAARAPGGNEGRHGSAEAARAPGGNEGRHGSAGAARAPGGMGGHIGAPHPN